MRGLFACDVAEDRGGVTLRLLAVAALAAFALLWAAASASAAPTWLASTNLSEAGANAEGPQVAVDPQGDAVAVWQRYDGTDWIIQAASREAGGAWSVPVGTQGSRSSQTPRVSPG